MKKNNQLGYILASLYLLTAVVILFRWATGISPVIYGLGEGHSILEGIILSLPIVPAIVTGFFFDLFNINYSDSLVFVEFTSTFVFIVVVVINTISWFYIGKLIQPLISKLSPTTVIKDRKKKARSKV